MSRKPERLATGIVLGLFTVVTFIISLVLFQIASKPDDADMKEIMAQLLPDLSAAEQVATLRTMGVWMCATILCVLILVIVAIVLLKKNRRPVFAGILLVASGFMILIGTQNIGFLFALAFFVIGGMCFIRKPKQVDS